MNAFWDQRYAEPGFKYGTEPNAFLVAQAAALRAGSDIVLPGDGEGRNSVWLARQGHHVLAMDSSAVGLAKAAALARDQGVPLRTVQADLADWAPEVGSVDAVVLIYVHLPSAVRRGAHRRLAAALRSGGRLILEAFHPSQLGRTSGGPKDVDMLVTLADLRADFAGLLDEQAGEEVETVLSEGPGHQGPARITRWVGCRNLVA
jgi:NAD(P)-dependent dehydrogenase (short-subunit alcohol dehydrogenase family)